MRKGISILFAMVIILSGAHYTVATHFCGGEVAATKVSLSGKLASCGMEETDGCCPLSNNQITTHCCDNSVTTIGIVNNFIVPVIPPEEITQYVHNVLYVPVNLSFHLITADRTIYTRFNPPGRFLINAVDLTDICVFRI